MIANVRGNLIQPFRSIHQRQSTDFSALARWKRVAIADQIVEKGSQDCMEMNLSEAPQPLSHETGEFVLWFVSQLNDNQMIQQLWDRSVKSHTRSNQINQGTQPKTR